MLTVGHFGPEFGPKGFPLGKRRGRGAGWISCVPASPAAQVGAGLRAAAENAPPISRHVSQNVRPVELAELVDMRGVVAARAAGLLDG